MTGTHTFDVTCPQCGEKEWELEYHGEYDKGHCDETETLDSYLCIHGEIVIACKCGFTKGIHIGCD